MSNLLYLGMLMAHSHLLATVFCVIQQVSPRLSKCEVQVVYGHAEKECMDKTPSRFFSAVYLFTRGRV